MHLDPLSLRLFIAVIEEGTIAQTAQRCHIAASAVSKRLSELEDSLQTSLLERTNKGVAPTAAGIELLQLARSALNELEQVNVRMRDFASGLRDHVRVFANISAITQFLPREISTFLASYPQVQVHLEEKISAHVTQAVAENAADIGIIARGLYGQALEKFPYHSDELIVITPSQHPLSQRQQVTFAELLDYDFVGLHTGSAINMQLQKAASALERQIKLRMQVTSFDALCLMVEAGLGIGILPKAVARPYRATLGIHGLELKEPWAARELLICVRSYEALPRAARLLVDHLRQL